MTDQKIFPKDTALCPCQSGNAYADCCGLLHSGGTAKTAEQLMRSRYSAYYLQKIDYIVATTVPSQQSLLDVAALQTWAEQTQWLGLQIISTETLDKCHAYVEFEARFQGAEQIETHNERSLFVQIDGRWYFVDPTVPLPTMKQPCLCGSGKKFKHCCGGLL